MRKFIISVLVFINSLIIFGQSPGAEQHAIDSLNRTGKLSTEKAAQLRKAWNSFILSYTYPEFNFNKRTGEIEFSDIISFPDLDKKTIYQRCLQWIAINYGALQHSDLESGKIICSATTDLTHYAEYPSGFGSRDLRKVQTPTTYTMILTLKDNKVKYIITNIIYTFTNYSETVDQISFPMPSLFPIVVNDQLQWTRIITVFNASINKFNKNLKDSLVNYINEAGDDYKF